MLLAATAACLSMKMERTTMMNRHECEKWLTQNHFSKNVDDVWRKDLQATNHRLDAMNDVVFEDKRLEDLRHLVFGDYTDSYPQILSVKFVFDTDCDVRISDGDLCAGDDMRQVIITALASYEKK